MTTRLEQAQARLLTDEPELLAEATKVWGNRLSAEQIWHWACLPELSRYGRNWEQAKLDHAPRSKWYGPRGRWLTVYHIHQAYGGPEEGGWWYNAGERIEYVDATGRDLHNATMELVVKHDPLNDPRGLYSVISTGVIRIEGPSQYPGPKYTPEYRPQYC